MSVSICATAVWYFFVAVALRVVCFVTASSAEDLAATFFVESLVMSAVEQGVVRDLISNKVVIKVVTPAGLFANIRMMSSIKVSTEVQVVGTVRLKRLLENFVRSSVSSFVEASLAAAIARSAAAISLRADSLSALA